MGMEAGFMDTGASHGLDCKIWGGMRPVSSSPLSRAAVSTALSHLHRPHSIPYPCLRTSLWLHDGSLTLQGVADSWRLPLCHQTDLTVRKYRCLRTSIAC